MLSYLDLSVPSRRTSTAVPDSISTDICSQYIPSQGAVNFDVDKLKGSPSFTVTLSKLTRSTPVAKGVERTAQNEIPRCVHVRSIKSMNT